MYCGCIKVVTLGANLMVVGERARTEELIGGTRAKDIWRPAECMGTFVIHADSPDQSSQPTLRFSHVCGEVQCHFVSGLLVVASSICALRRLRRNQRLVAVFTAPRTAHTAS